MANEYVVVFFCGAMKYRPSFSWMYHAYQRLERNYKKNVKRLIIIHPSVWFKVLLTIMQKIVSSKFANKIVCVETLEQAEQMLPLDRIEVPAVIRAWERGDTIDPEEGTLQIAALPAVKLYGASLETAEPSGGIPDKIRVIIEYLEENAMEYEGIFRKSPEAILMSKLKHALDRGVEIDLNDYDVHTIASLLKAYIRELPIPLIPPETYDSMNEYFAQPSDEDIAYFLKKNFISKMSDQSTLLLDRLLSLLSKVLENGDVNKMTARNLSVVWAPNLIRPSNPEEEIKYLKVAQSMVEFMITHYEDFFS